MPPADQADAESDPRTPTMSSIDITDWQQLASDAQQELASQRRRLERAWKENRRQQQQIGEYCEALTRSTQDCNQLMSQCQQLSNNNIQLIRENEKAKNMVETLEAVIMMLHAPSSAKEAAQAYRTVGMGQANGGRAE